MRQEVSAFSMILTLGGLGTISGGLLVFTYLFTLPYIEANRQRELEKAIFHVLPGCRRYVPLALKEGKLVELKDKRQKSFVYAGFDDKGKLIGFALVGSEPGFQDVIRAIFGVKPVEKMVVGFQVLESRETPGLGDKIYKDSEFLANFRALSIEPEIRLVKKGKKTRPNEVEAITGATISSKAVVRLIRKALKRWLPYLKGYWGARRRHG